MKIYNKIKNPLNDKKNIKKLVEAYFKARENNENFYGHMVKCGSKNEEFDNKEFANFKRHIEKMELKDIRSFNEKDVKRKRIITENKVVRFFMQRLPGLNSMLSYMERNYPKYSEYLVAKKYSDDKIFSMYDKIKKSNKPYSSLSKDEEAILGIMDRYVVNRHSFPGLAGYHVYSDMYSDGIKRKKEPHYKLYLNLNYNQLYKFAEKYMEVCKAEKIPYLYKVMSPVKDSPDRTEKMCIYCTEEEFGKVVDIVRAIKKANPELNPSKPPITAGVLDGWIGIGSDPTAGRMSHNGLRAKCVEQALNEYFKGMSTRKAKKVIKNNPKALAEIKMEIDRQAEKMGIVPDKFCFTQVGNEAIKKEDKKYKSKPLHISNSKLRIKGLKKTYFDEYVNIRNQYGKDSRQVRDLCRRISKNRKQANVRNVQHKQTNRNITRTVNYNYKNHVDDLCI